MQDKVTGRPSRVWAVDAHAPELPSLVATEEDEVMGLSIKRSRSGAFLLLASEELATPGPSTRYLLFAPADNPRGAPSCHECAHIQIRGGLLEMPVRYNKHCPNVWLSRRSNLRDVHPGTWAPLAARTEGVSYDAEHSGEFFLLIVRAADSLNGFVQMAPVAVPDTNRQVRSLLWAQPH